MNEYTLCAGAGQAWVGRGRIPLNQRQLVELIWKATHRTLARDRRESAI